jgi:biotin synthase
MLRFAPVARRVAPAFARSLATHVAPAAAPARKTWAREEIQAVYDTPLLDLVFRAASVHRMHHDPSKIQLCTLMNIKSASIPRCHIPTATHCP